MLRLDWSVPYPFPPVRPVTRRAAYRASADAAFLIARRQVVIASGVHQISVIDLDSGQILRTLESDRMAWISSIVPADDERKLVIMSSSDVCVCDLDEADPKQAIVPLERPGGPIKHTAYGRLCKLLPDDRTLLIANANQTVDVWDVIARQHRFRLPTPPQDKRCRTDSIRDFHASPYVPGQVVVNYEGSSEKMPYVSIDELGYSRMIGYNLSDESGGYLPLWDHCYPTEVQQVIFQRNGVQVWASIDIPELCCVNSATGEIVREVKSYWRLSGVIPDASGDPHEIVVTHTLTGKYHHLRLPDFERLGEVTLPPYRLTFDRDPFLYVEDDHTMGLWSLAEGRGIAQQRFHTEMVGWWYAPQGDAIVMTENQQMHRVKVEEQR